ncbi:MULTISPECIES: SsrA-binding protein SmpB [unclassified Hymenobacter]|uniref:SsrA-binding protein SmpB n=1 Tax=unclassified Hymenobacter TaxID=2615202 RepID=UPI0006BD8B3F|nr:MULTISPECIES: SsrA-binding protein SmpB [unclassified Hymenobacter]ALD20352.1 single-stranded DNA-binding protein [Hymenobacter sp. DG25A]
MAKQKDDTPKRISILNRRASHEYAFLVKYDAGMMLQGTEIKSIRDGNVNLQDGFCTFHSDGSLWVHNLSIAQYALGTYNNHEPKRERKLLLNKRELRQLADKSQEQGLTIIPIRLFVTDRGFAKLEIALAKGKKLYDKREDLKAKDQKREMDRLRDY